MTLLGNLNKNQGTTMDNEYEEEIVGPGMIKPSNVGLHTWQFIHIPKTAGTSFVAAYGRGPTYPLENNLNQDHHCPADALPAGVRPVSIFRNPLDRAVSICAHLHKGLVPFLTMPVFNGWVLNGLPLTLNYPGKPEVCCPPVWVPKGAPTRLLTLTDQQAAWLSPNSLLLRYEALPQAIRALAPVLGLEQPSPNLIKAMPHLNASKRLRDFNDYYNEETRLIIRQRYQTDLTIWEHLRKGINNGT